MNDPERLLQSGTDAELALLRAAASEEPPSHGKQRLAAALGLAAAASLPTSAAAKLGYGGAKLLGKGWLLLGSGALLLGVGAYLGAQAVQPSFAPLQPVPTRVQPSLAPIESPAASTEPPAPVAEPAREAPSRRAPAAKDRLTAEIAALDEARRQLPNAPQAALAALTRYDQQFPKGVLRQEALLLRIESLSRAGQRVEARKLAERFLKANPGTPHEHRVRALAGLPE